MRGAFLPVKRTAGKNGKVIFSSPLSPHSVIFFLVPAASGTPTD
jgi:hypothetical protein